MAIIKIPPVLRASVGGEKEVSASGENIGAVLRDLASSHPATQSQLFSSEGELNRYVNVYLNDEDVRVLDGLDTPVAEGDTLVLIESMKMEIPVVAEKAGTVASILVAEGDGIIEGQSVVTLET